MRPNTIVVAMLGVAALASCGNRAKQEQRLALEGWSEATAPLIDTKGAEIGVVGFRQAPDGVMIRISAKKIARGWHGVHLHEKGDCTDGKNGFKASGGHFDPDNHDHGLLHVSGGERGDLPNIYADKKGRIEAELYRAGVLLRPSEEGAARVGPHALIDDDGFAVVVHADPDDQTSQPIGGSGDRIACAAVTN